MHINRYLNTDVILFFWSSILLFSVTGILQAQPLQIQGIQQSNRIYKIVKKDTLRLHIFEDSTLHSDAPKPAIVFFFGGGWVTGNPDQFYPHAEYFASRGMIAVSADYRVKSREGTSPFAAVKDGKSAINWVRLHADKLGIDPDKIVAAGGSAGGHVAACTAFVPGFSTELIDSAVSSQPDALVLFNPVLDTGPKGYGYDRLKEKYKSISPVDHINPGAPPTIIFHGTSDNTVSFENIRRFKHIMNDKGNTCKVIAFRNKDHGFFNYSKGRHGPFWQTVCAADRFLVRLGILHQDYETTIVK